MKQLSILIFLYFIGVQVQGQRLKVRQSMETADSREEPAQFQITAPVGDKPSFLFNGGISFRIDDSTAHSFLSKINAEYHRNTSLEQEQNNFSIGYSYTWRLFGLGKSSIFSAGDANYIYDAFDSAHSVGNRKSYFLSFFGGAQYQQYFLQTSLPPRVLS